MEEHTLPEMVENSEMDVKPYFCEMCHEAFTDLNDFLHHKVTLCSGEPRTVPETDIKPHLCDMCNETFTDMNSFLSHKEQHGFQQEQKSEESSTNTREKERMSELWNSGSHSVSSASDYQAFYVCSHCRSIFRREEDLQRHLGEHDMMGINTEIKTETVKSEFPSEAPQPYEPRPLEQYIDTLGRIQVQQTMHTHETYQCEKCQQSVTPEQQLKTHDMTVHNEKNSHKSGNIRNHSGGKLRICDQCGKGFKKSIDLIRHIRTHSGERPFKCDQCDKTFTWKSALTRHLRIHSGEKTYQCDQCDKAFAVKCALAMHLRTHSGEKPFQCDQCDKAFTQKTNLTNHLRTHSREKPFKCDQCDKAFAVKCALAMHLRTHSGEKPFQCDQCDKAFTHKTNLTRR